MCLFEDEGQIVYNSVIKAPEKRVLPELHISILK